MTLLNDWRAKPSYQMTLPLCFRVCQSALGEDIDLAALCSQEKTLTLSPGKGFEEIYLKDPCEEIPQEWQYLTQALPKYSPDEWSLEDIIHALVQ